MVNILSHHLKVQCCPRQDIYLMIQEKKYTTDVLDQVILSWEGLREDTYRHHCTHLVLLHMSTQATV